MNPYELIILLDPKLGEEKIDLQINKVEEKLKAFGGEVTKTEKWGNKRLASMMRNAKSLTQAYYTLIRFNGEATVPAEICAYLKVTEAVVRYFISKEVTVESATSERRDISGAPLEEVPLAEIKGEPIGKPE